MWNMSLMLHGYCRAHSLDAYAFRWLLQDIVRLVMSVCIIIRFFVYPGTIMLYFANTSMQL